MREFVLETNGRTEVRRVWTDGPTLHTERGTLGQKLEHTASTKEPLQLEGQTIEPESYALIMANRFIRRLTEHGYQETNPFTHEPLLKTAENMLSILEALPSNLRMWRPSPWHKATLMLPAVEWLITPHLFGENVVVLINKDGVPLIYTECMENKSDNFPWLIQELVNAKLPKKTLLRATLVPPNGSGYLDGAWSASTLLHNSSRTARAYQLLPDMSPHAVFFSVDIYEGATHKYKTPWAERFAVLNDIFAERDMSLCRPIETFFVKPSRFDAVIEKRRKPSWCTIWGFHPSKCLRTPFSLTNEPLCTTAGIYALWESPSTAGEGSGCTTGPSSDSGMGTPSC